MKIENTILAQYYYENRLWHVTERNGTSVQANLTKLGKELFILLSRSVLLTVESHNSQFAKITKYFTLKFQLSFVASRDYVAREPNSLCPVITILNLLLIAHET